MTSLERVIAKNPTSSLFARLADACLSQGDVNRAIEICRRGLRYRPSYVSGHVVLGKSHFAAGTLEEARRAFNKALHLDPHHTVAIWYLGQIDRTMGWDDLALRNFQKARDLDPLSQSLQRAIEEILTSISSQMGQRLLNEVGGESDPAAERDDPANRPERPERRETEEGRSQDRLGAGMRDPSASAADRIDPEKTAISRLVEEIETAPVSGERRPGRKEPESVGTMEAGTTSGGTTALETPAQDGMRAMTGGVTPGAGAAEENVPQALPPPDAPPALAPAPGDESEKSPLPAAGEALPALANRRRRPGGDRPFKGNGAGPGRRSGRSAENGGEGSRWEDIPITTATLAEIYAGQGLIAQAIAIFERVLEREPDNARAQERLNALRAQRVASTPQ